METDDWAVFAGACGHTYGCHDVWQFYAPGRNPITAARTPWRQALLLPGAQQMKHLRALIESRPMLTRVPDQSLIVGDAGRGTDRIAASRALDGSYAMVYASSGRPFAVDLGKLSASQIRPWWLDPRTGTAREGGTFPRRGTKQFQPPSRAWARTGCSCSTTYRVTTIRRVCGRSDGNPGIKAGTDGRKRQRDSPCGEQSSSVSVSWSRHFGPATPRSSGSIP